MTFQYTRSNLITRINAGIQGKIGVLISSTDMVNEAIRNITSKVDLVSTRRRSVLTPDLYNGVHIYSAPTDLKGFSIIDIPTQAREQRADGEWQLVPSEYFERMSSKQDTILTVDDYNGQRVLKLNSVVDSDTHVFSTLDSLTAGGGTWSAYGDTESLAADTDDYIKGNGSLKFDISSAGGTTAGIQNAGLNSFDMTDYFGGTSAFFVWKKIASTTNLTNFIIEFGTDTSNYYKKTITTQSDGTAFVNGWNLLRFDVESLTTTGTPTDTDIKSIRLYMTKDTAKVSESDYKFDNLALKRGITSYLKYYSKYGWQNSSGTYIENSTDDSDLLLADTDEFNLFVQEGRVIAGDEVGLTDAEISRKEKARDIAIKEYEMKHPSEAKFMSYDYFNF